MNTDVNVYTGGPQQAYLFAVPPVVIGCAHCHQPKSKVESDRRKLIAQFPDRYLGLHEARVAVICCTPDCEWRCPACGSESLSFSEYDSGTDAETGYHDAGELFACQDCPAMGDAEDCKPPVQPWAELEAVAKLMPAEDDFEMARRGAPILREVA